MRPHHRDETAVPFCRGLTFEELSEKYPLPLEMCTHLPGVNADLIYIFRFDGGNIAHKNKRMTHTGFLDL